MIAGTADEEPVAGLDAGNSSGRGAGLSRIWTDREFRVRAPAHRRHLLRRRRHHRARPPRRPPLRPPLRQSMRAATRLGAAGAAKGRRNAL